MVVASATTTRHSPLRRKSSARAKVLAYSPSSAALPANAASVASARSRNRASSVTAWSRSRTSAAVALGELVGASWIGLARAVRKPAPDAPVGEISELENPADPIQVVPYELSLHYEHAFGPYYGRMFDEIKSNRKIMGVRTPDGEGAFLPPREICDVTHKPTGAWVQVGQTGTVRAMSIIHMEFVGQTRKPPYIYAEIKLDGASTRLIHNVHIPDMSKAKELVKPGTRVRAVWREGEATGSLADISHFEVIDE